MRNVAALALVVAALVYFNRSCHQPGLQARGPDRRSEQVSGGAVHQMEHAPTDLMQMGDAMPQGGGSSSKAMLDTARGAAK